MADGRHATGLGHPAVDAGAAVAQDGVDGVGGTAQAEFGGEVGDFSGVFQSAHSSSRNSFTPFVELPPVHRLQAVLLLGAAVGDDLLLHVEKHKRLPERQPFFRSEPGQGCRDRNLGLGLLAGLPGHQEVEGDAQGTGDVEQVLGPDASLAVLQIRQETLGNPGFLGQLVLGPAEFQPPCLDSFADAGHLCSPRRAIEGRSP